MRFGVLVLDIGLAGCNQILGVGPVESAPDGSITVPPDQLHGTSTITWVHAGSSDALPEDLRAYTIRALVRDPQAAGGFRTVTGAGGADGTFAIPVAPDGDVYVELTRPGALTHAIYHVDRAALDAGYTTLGHAGPAVTAKTPVVLDLSTITAWTSGDAFHLTSYGAGADRDATYGFTGMPAIGATSTSGTTFDWSLATVLDPATPPRPIDGAHGDDLWIAHTQGVSITDAAGATANLTRIIDSADLSGVAMSDGGTTTVTGALAPVPLDHTQDFAIDLGAWFAADAARTTADVSCSRVEEPAAGYGLALGIPAWQLWAHVDPATPTRSFPSMAYADPFPAAWPAMIHCDAGRTWVASIPGGPNLMFLVHGIVDLPAGRNVTAHPTLAAPADPTFGGVPFATDGQTVQAGGAPITIAWTASPWATQYHVDIRRYVQNGLPPVEVVATFDTTATSVDVPLDIITPGSYYIVSLWSVKATGGLPGGQLRQVGAFGERAMVLSKAILVN